MFLINNTEYTQAECDILNAAVDEVCAALGCSPHIAADRLLRSHVGPIDDDIIVSMIHFAIAS